MYLNYIYILYIIKNILMFIGFILYLIIYIYPNNLIID